MLDGCSRKIHGAGIMTKNDSALKFVSISTTTLCMKYLKLLRQITQSEHWTCWINGNDAVFSIVHGLQSIRDWLVHMCRGHY